MIKKLILLLFKINSKHKVPDLENCSYQIYLHYTRMSEISESLECYIFFIIQGL